MKRLIVLIIMLTLIPASSLYACLGFCISKGDTVLVGNNEDYMDPDTKVFYVPAEKGKYGGVYFGFDSPSFPMGGMNEKGLVFDMFSAPPKKVKNSLDKPNVPVGQLIDKVMSECATVDEVLDFFEEYNLAWMERVMFFIADENGDSAIIEGDTVLRKKGKYQVVTNFYQSETRKEDIHIICGRYPIAAAILEDADDISVDLGKRVLAATHQEGPAQTLYSNVYDLKRRIVHLYHFHNFQNEVVIDLETELAKGARTIDLPDLFPKTFVAENFKNASKGQKAPPPDNVSYVKPADDVPKNIQNLLGRWEGDWSGLLDSYMIFEEVTTNSARVILGWGTAPLLGVTEGEYYRDTASLIYTGDNAGIDFEFGIYKGTLSADGKTIDAVRNNGQAMVTMKKTEDPLSDN